ncbi:MAG: ATP-binding protein [Methanomicrobiales archaeon HGW-Methanomicrobiales-3]|jgi:serine/threonine-protein kinase RsbW|nr:MAG: ATP-binding protein [Methanomicrobiales archaeon HGW-Methanomicrobiales-3]
MDPPVTLKISSDIAEIPEVSARLEELMEAYGFAPEAILDTQLAVEEAITNIIVHGYKRPDGEIQITCSRVSDAIEIRIADSAPPFDPLSLPEPDLSSTVSERRIGGLGIYLIRRVMDGFFYRYEDGKNILTLIKKKAD